MGYLLGLDEYLAANYEVSVFDKAVASGVPWELHLHGGRVVTATLSENRKWDVTLKAAGQEEEELQKIQVKYLYPAEQSRVVKPLVKSDKKVEELALTPILSPRGRYFIKNKSLFPFMKDKEVLFFTLLEGEIIKGILTDFSRYDITVALKGGLPVTILRHSIYDVKNKKGRSFLKSFQEEHRDWEKSPLFVQETQEGK
jgi:hypothetical protein